MRETASGSSLVGLTGYVQSGCWPVACSLSPVARSMPSSTVILVHGLWMSGFELGVLKHRLEADGQFRAVAFSYPSLSGSMSDHVRSLIDFAHAQHDRASCISSATVSAASSSCARCR